MKLQLVLRLESDPASVWRRTVERPYEGVPRLGDRLFLDDEGTAAHFVKRVTWANDGDVTIGFGTIDESEKPLRAFGFAKDS